MSKREELADLLARQNGYTSLLAMPDYMRDKWFNRADEVMNLFSDEDDWIEWVGGKQPVKDFTKVEILTRNNDEWEGYAQTWQWSHNGSEYDITAYRVVK